MDHSLFTEMTNAIDNHDCNEEDGIFGRTHCTNDETLMPGPEPVDAFVEVSNDDINGTHHYATVEQFCVDLSSAKPNDVLQIVLDIGIKYGEIFRVKTYRKGRLRKTLQTGWSSQLSEYIWEQLKLPCCLKWNNGNVRMDDIICKGECKEESCSMQIECVAVPNKLAIIIKHYDAECHHATSYKRRILTVDKLKYQEMLKGKSAFDVRCVLADKLIPDNAAEIKMEPSVLPKIRALQHIKYSSDLPKEKPMLSLLTLKKAHPDAIKFIGLDPFCLLYSTKMQQIFYRGEGYRKRTVVSIDATGLG